jgi:FkbM family methyltransferase
MTRDKMQTEFKLPLLLRLMQRIDFPHKLGICERLFGKKLSRSGTRWVQCANGVFWKLDLSNSSHRWCVFGDYEGASQMRWVRQWLKDGGHAVDSGANIGQMTLSMLPLEGVTIHAFEPTKSAGDWLEYCVHASALSKVRLIRSGLSSQPGRMAIQLDGARSTLRMDWYRNAGLETETVELIRLDDYLKKVGVSSVRLWKLDVEGHELEALAGASLSLDRKAIDAILIEVSESTFDDVKSFLAQKRYELFEISGTGSLGKFVGAVKHNFNLVAIPRR